MRSSSRRTRSRRQVPVGIVRGGARRGLPARGDEDRSVNLLVLCPHFAPDVAPTGEVMTSIATELVARGHRLHVVTSLPWYVHHRIEEGWTGRLVRQQDTDWGRITRVHPFPTDKRNIPARALAFGGFTRSRRRHGRRVAAAARRRARDVAPADARRGRLAGRSGPAGAVRVQHPGRVPGRRRRARRHHQPDGDRDGVAARAPDLSPRRRGHRAVRGPARQRRLEDRRPPARAGAGHPELRRRRADPARRRRRTRTAGSSASPARPS